MTKKQPNKHKIGKKTFDQNNLTIDIHKNVQINSNSFIYLFFQINNFGHSF